VGVVAKKGERRRYDGTHETKENLDNKGLGNASEQPGGRPPARKMKVKKSKKKYRGERRGPERQAETNDTRSLGP